MDKKNIIIVLLVVALGILAYFNFQEKKVDNGQEEVSQTNQLSAGDLFQKKQGCQSYRAQIEVKLKGLDFFNPDTGYQSAHFLEKLFFSPESNSCLYVEKEWGFVNKKITWEILTLNDALTGEILTSSIYEIESKEYLQQKQAFEDYLKDYE